MRIAMWSGPRNLSTAMMYAFGNRADCAVIDEPFYSAYLERTGLAHPMRDAILAAQPTDPAAVVATLRGPVPGQKTHFYQKHMTQHMVPGIPRDWMQDMRNVFLIRHPARVVASFSAKYESLTLADIGFAQQADLFDKIAAQGGAPLVIDSFDIRQDSQAMLQRLCAALDLAWDANMLHWPAGGHPADGVWAPHWYGAVHKSTGFGGAEGDLPDLDADMARLAEQAMPFFDRLAAKKI